MRPVDEVFADGVAVGPATVQAHVVLVVQMVHAVHRVEAGPVGVCQSGGAAEDVNVVAIVYGNNYMPLNGLAGS